MNREWHIYFKISLSPYIFIFNDSYWLSKFLKGSVNDIFFFNDPQMQVNSDLWVSYIDCYKHYNIYHYHHRAQEQSPTALELSKLPVRSGNAVLWCRIVPVNTRVNSVKEFKTFKLRRRWPRKVKNGSRDERADKVCA